MRVFEVHNLGIQPVLNINLYLKSHFPFILDPVDIQNSLLVKLISTKNTCVLLRIGQFLVLHNNALIFVFFF